MLVNQLWKQKMWVVVVLLVFSVLLGPLHPGSRVFATPGSGVSAETIVTGNLVSPVSAKFKADFGNINAKVSRTTLIRYTITPGGVFGWHQHGGPLWVIVESGTLTFYEADDPTCTGKQYPAGTSFMDPGSHSHNARNEGTENLVIYVVFMLPEGGAPRIDIPDPGNCSF